jgi:2'-5' RNA ligase
MRAFIAIKLPLNLKSAISGIQEELKRTLPTVSWTKPDNLHITLKFLGEISPEQAVNIKQIITENAKATFGFRIKLETLGVFPNTRCARIIYMGANEGSLEIKQIVEQLELKLAQLGIPKENRSFSSHITIGRIRSRIGQFEIETALNKASRLLDNKNFGFVADSITLFKSTLGVEGPTYTVLEEANLRIS